jgi:hypothetical protein
MDMQIALAILVPIPKVVNIAWQLLYPNEYTFTYMKNYIPIFFMTTLARNQLAFLE